MKKTLKVLMMLGCFPMMLSAKEYKKSESLSLDKGWEFACRPERMVAGYGARNGTSGFDFS